MGATVGAVVVSAGAVVGVGAKVGTLGGAVSSASNGVNGWLFSRWVLVGSGACVRGKKFGTLGGDVLWSSSMVLGWSFSKNGLRSWEGS